MNRTVLRKSAYDQRWVLAIVCFGSTVFALVILFAFASFDWEVIQKFFNSVPWLSHVITAIAGTDINDMWSSTALASFVFAHPVILTMTWAYLIAAATRGLCGEIDQGTAEWLLTMPVSRFSIYGSVSVALVLSCLAMTGCLCVGVFIADKTADLPEPIQMTKLFRVVANAFALQLSVTGISLVCAATDSRRGRAVGVVTAIVLVSFLLNSLAAFWPPIKPVATVSLMNYFRPFVVVKENAFPVRDITVLLSVAVVTWTAGAVIFSRRDIPAS